MKNIIYIRMPRCGSTSIVNFFCNKNIKSFGGRDMGFWGYDSILKKNSSERLYECIENHVGKKTYRDSFVFSSVRNPYSRAVSMYKHESWDCAKTFKEFCRAVKTNKYPHPRAKWHSSTLTEHIIDKDNNLKVDFVIRLENAQEDLNIVCDKIAIPRQQLPHKNKSKHRHYTEYYDDETRQIIAEKYARDIEFFGYEFDIK